MNSLTIEWDVLRNGDFPVEAVESCNLNVEIVKSSVFKESITLTSNTDELITPELAFYLGALVSSEVCVNRFSEERAAAKHVFKMADKILENQ